MRKILTLARKEWRENLWFLLAGIPLFLVPPVYDAFSNRGLGHYRGFYTDASSELVIWLGPAFALLLGVAVACRDLRGPLQDFWQSRPIGLNRWLTAKFFVGLGIVLLICGMSMVFQIATEMPSSEYYLMAEEQGAMGLTVDTDTVNIVAHFGFTLTLVYGLSFLLGCLVRRAAHAAILSVAAFLVIFFLPMILPPLGWLSVFNLIEERRLVISVLPVSAPDSGLWTPFSIRHIPGTRQWIRPYPEYLWFVTTMSGAIAGVLLLAWLAVRRDWRLRLGQRTMCWTLGVVAVIFFAAAGFQIGANLELKKRIPLPGTAKRVYEMAFHEGKGLIATEESKALEGKWNHTLRAVDFTNDAVQFGPPLWIGKDVDLRKLPARFQKPKRIEAEARNLVPLTGGDDLFAFVFDVQYFVNSREQPAEKWRTSEDAFRAAMQFCVAETRSDTEPEIRYCLDLLELYPKYEKHSYFNPPVIHLVGSRIYLGFYTGQLAEIDLTDLDHPVVADLEITPRDYLDTLRLKKSLEGAASLELPLIPVQGLRPIERLQLTLSILPSYMQWQFGFADGLLVAAPCYGSGGLNVFRLEEFTENQARFSLASRRQSSPLERLFRHRILGIDLSGNQAFVSHPGSGLTVYDLSEPSRPRRTGYYEAANEWLQSLALLPDGAVLLGGKSLHLVALPKP